MWQHLIVIFFQGDEKVKKEVDEDVDWEVEMVDEWLEVLEIAISVLTAALGWHLITRR